MMEDMSLSSAKDEKGDRGKGESSSRMELTRRRFTM